MSSQDMHVKGSSLGSHRKLIGGNEHGGNSRGHYRGKKGKGRGRWFRGKGWFRGRGSGRGGARELAKTDKKDSGKLDGDKGAEKISQSEDETQLDQKINEDASLKDEQSLDDKEDNFQLDGETQKSEDCIEEMKDSSVGEENAYDSTEEVKNKVDNMEVTAQSGDQKNKLLEMMSRQFNSADILEGSVPLDTKKNPRLPRLTRKRKSEVLDSADKTAEVPLTQQTSISLVTTHSNNPITSALKKVRKESLENLPAPSASPTSGRTRRSGQETKSGSDKDPTEETTSISENSEAETKTEEASTSERPSLSIRGKKRGRGRGRSLMEGGDLGINSGNDSLIIPTKGRGKVRTSSEGDLQNTSTELPAPSASRGRGRGRGFGENEVSTPVGRGRGRGRGVVKEESVGDNKGRGKQKGEREKSEEPVSVITTPGIGRGRGRGKVVNEDGGSSVPSNSPVGGVGRRGRGKIEVDREGTSETELGGRQRRSMTPLRSDTTPQSEPKRSQRLSVPRDGSQDPPLTGKRGKPKIVPELLKKQETVAVTKAYPSRGKKEEVEINLTKTGKKKKKHFKGLSYSFKTKKKKGKGKLSIGRTSFDATQETDSVISEEIDMESMDSSSQDVPSEQLSFRDQDGIEDGLSEGADNDDIDMDNIDADGEAEDEHMDDLSPENTSTNPGQDLGGPEDDVPADEESSNDIDLDEEQTSEAIINKNTIDGTIVDKDCDESISTTFDENKEMANKIIKNFTDEKSSINFNVHDNLVKVDVCKESSEMVAGSRDDATFQDTVSGIALLEGSSNIDISIENTCVERTLHVEPADKVSIVEGPVSAEIAGIGPHKDESTSVDLTAECSATVNPDTYELTDETVQQEMQAKPTEENLTYTSQYSSNLLSVAADPLLEYSAIPGAEEVLPEEGATIAVEESGHESTVTQLSVENPHLVAVDDAAVMDDGKQSVTLSSRCDAKSEIGNTSPQEGLLKTEVLCHSVREPLSSNDSAMRYSGRRRHSVSKRRLDDLGFEGHNSDSSDSLSEARPPGEGVRKSKRLSRNSSPHPLAIAAPRSPEGAGKGQSKPIGTQSAYVTPVSPEECHRFILSTPVTLTQGCQQQGIDQSAAPSLTNVLCKCRIKENPVAVGITGDVYCQAVDSFDGRMIGCCNVVTNHRYLRVSGKIPFMLLCAIHRQRLRRHNCCPCCGLFCSQGVFYECSWDTGGSRHYYHKLCGLMLAGTTLCPHCGSEEPPKEVQLELKLSRKPVVYLKQHQERKEALARMTWSKKVVSGLATQTAETVPGDEPTVELRNGRVISAHKLPLGLGREKLQEGIRAIRDGKTINANTFRPSPKGIYWACKQNDLEKLLHVLVHGVSPNVKVKEYGNQTGMHVAAAYGNLAAIHVLALAGATIDMTDTQLMTPLMVAIIKEQNSVVHYLIQAGASLMAKTQDGMTCLHLAAKGGNFLGCQHILDSGRLSRHAINMQDEGGWTPLVWASENRFTNVVKFLLDRGGNPQLCDVEQNTALHWAAFSGSTYICSMVLDRGCSLRSMNAHGDTPLHIAARQNHTDAVVLLLARGARLDVLNSKGQTPIQCSQPDTDVFLQLTLNHELLDVMKQNNIRTEKILSSDIAAGKEEVPIPCVNGEDDDSLPRDYLYIAENCEASNVIIDRTITSLKWCECEDGCNADHCGCGQLNFQCWYDPDGRLLPDFNYADPPMIFECNRACRCNKLSCNNRVVQHGISAHMQLFKTDGKGWGVRALKIIQKGSYVCEYVGEIITDLEADQRRDDSYLFDLDNKDSETFCIDARAYGNIARFINHLCEANLTPVKLFIDHQDLTFPRIAFFANRDIEADEELGFDYGEKFWIIKYKHFTCTCGSEKCKYSSETIHTTLENYNKKIRELQESM